MNKDDFKVKANQTIEEISTLIDDLNKKKAELKLRYLELESATDEKWDSVKAAFSSTADSVKVGFSKLKAML